MTMEKDVAALFDRYAASMNRALAGRADVDEAARLYAPCYIAASPDGLMTGVNDEALKQALSQGFRHYRDTGAREMRVGRVDLTPLGPDHCVAHVAWSATYARADGATEVLAFTVHYFVRRDDAGVQVFGWVSGDERALLREHGLG